MKYFILLSLFLLALSTPILPPTSPVTIRPLSWQSDELEGLQTNHCTTWAYTSNSQGSQKVHWISAGHCVIDVDSQEVQDHPYQIGGLGVKVEKVDVDQDMVSFEGGPDSKGLPLAKEEGVVGTAVFIKGYAFGWKEPTFTSGFISNTGIDFDDASYAVYQLPVAPGDSGAPVLNEKAQVVGLQQVSFCNGAFWDGFCPVSGGATLSSLKAFLSDLK